VSVSDERGKHVAEGTGGILLPGSELEEAADAALARLREVPPEDPKTSPYRHAFLIGFSILIIGIVVWVSVAYGAVLFNIESADGQPPSTGTFLVPYLMCLAGVALFVMNTARKKREAWSLREYVGDHAFRLAQAYAYLFIVWWAIAAVGAESNEMVLAGTTLPPNIIGFLVGFFILRVERAMDGLGEKFEEVLTAILPRAISYVSAEERRRGQLKAAFRLEDLAVQWEALRPHIADEGAKIKIDEALDIARAAARREEPEQARLAAANVGRLFEDVKTGVSEVLIPVEDLLAHAIDRNGPTVGREPAD
jgi:hypothetical protein